MLSTRPLKPVPHDCDSCEFSFAITNDQPRHLVCCIRTNTHHDGEEPLCPWYVRAGLSQLQVELASRVPPWEKAIQIRDLKPPASLEAIVNILEGKAGKTLAHVEENNNEK